MLVMEANGRRPVTNLFCAAIDACRGEMCDVLIHQSLPIGGDAHPPVGPVFSKLLRQILGHFPDPSLI
jgi:hypothetical protein